MYPESSIQGRSLKFFGGCGRRYRGGRGKGSVPRESVGRLPYTFRLLLPTGTTVGVLDFRCPSADGREVFDSRCRSLEDPLI